MILLKYDTFREHDSFVKCFPTVCREVTLKNPISEGLNYKCQFCSKIGEYAYVVGTYETHEKTAVKHGGICYFR